MSDPRNPLGLPAGSISRLLRYMDSRTIKVRANRTGAAAVVDAIGGPDEVRRLCAQMRPQPVAQPVVHLTAAQIRERYMLPVKAGQEIERPDCLDAHEWAAATRLLVQTGHLVHAARGRFIRTAKTEPPAAYNRRASA